MNCDALRQRRLTTRGDAIVCDLITGFWRAEVWITKSRSAGVFLSLCRDCLKRAGPGLHCGFDPAFISASKENGTREKSPEMRNRICQAAIVWCLSLALVALAEACTGNPCLRGRFRRAAAQVDEPLTAVC